MPSATSESKWHLFNDFLVRPVLQEEALTFNTAWKLPSVIAYQVKAANNRIDDSWKQNLDTALLYQNQTYVLFDSLRKHHLLTFTKVVETI